MAENSLITDNNDSVIVTVAEVMRTVVSYSLTTSIGRKGIFIATLYYGGTLLVSIVGVPTIIIVGTVVLLL